MSDASVKDATGCTWERWVNALDYRQHTPGRTATSRSICVRSTKRRPGGRRWLRWAMNVSRACARRDSSVVGATRPRGARPWVHRSPRCSPLSRTPNFGHAGFQSRK
jgi:hypothetical protein